MSDQDVTRDDLGDGWQRIEEARRRKRVIDTAREILIAMIAKREPGTEIDAKEIFALSEQFEGIADEYAEGTSL